ncbi:hypothetical protein [Planococcus sp. SSTMD024]|uniref:hypothetical protein n=1 Tax=Planococcus sp. SSTMD024 TaxID=3242163 RepID=UPI00351EBA6A
MVRTYKSLHFHQFTMYERKFISDKKQADQQVKDYKDIEQINLRFQEIIDNHLINGCLKIQKDFDPDHTTLEILDWTNDFIFGRMGKERDMRAFHLREKETYKAEQIFKKEDQIFEVFTYLLIDRSTFIVSYLQESSAPSILKLGELISNKYKKDELFGEVSSVSVEDAIPFIGNKDVIGNVTYKTTLPPSDSRLWDENITGLDRETYDSIVNLKNVEITVKLVAERNKDIFPDKGLFTKVINKVALVGKKVKIAAKNEGELTQEHLLENNPLTKRVSFDFNQDLQDSKELQLNIKDQMKRVYYQNKKEVLKYCKV